MRWTGSSLVIKARTFRSCVSSVFSRILQFHREEGNMSPIMFLSFVVVLFIPALPIANCDDDCNHGFADTCFTSVTGDLMYMLNLKKMVAVNVTRATVHDLCLSIDDSLNCTADIIETECSDDAEVHRFESWLKSLRAAYSYICAGYEHKSLTTLLRGIECWSIEDFLMCVEGELGLTHVRDLLHTAIDEHACQDINEVFNKCNRQAVVGSCREQDDVSDEVDKMIRSFFVSACETNEIQNNPSASQGSSAPFCSMISLTTLLLLQTVLFI